MQALSASELLGAWERGLGQGLSERALTLLAASDPRNPRDVLARLSIGQRDAGLLSLRQELFGSQLTSLADCPCCGERLELGFNIADIQGSSTAATPAESPVRINDWQVEFRLPNSDHLLAPSDWKDVS